MPEFLVIGQGSMGRRRVRCLKANGVAAEKIAVFDLRPDRLAESARSFGVSVAESVASALSDKALRAVLVSVPGALHVEYCLAAARAGKHWFSEIPLAVSSEGLDELAELTEGRLIGAVGCQPLFHPLSCALREWAHAPQTGRVLAGTYTLGTYLPEWHPNEDYRRFYASNRALGGGNLDVIAQELTWLRWTVGARIEAITCRMSKIGPLELAPGTPDHHELIVEFENGLMLGLHFDLNDRTHERWLRLSAENSTAKWSALEPLLRIYDAAAGAWREERLPENFNYESCYEREIGQFLRAIETGEAWPVPLAAAREIVRVLAALEVSSSEKRSIALKELQ